MKIRQLGVFPPRMTLEYTLPSKVTHLTLTTLNIYIFRILSPTTPTFIIAKWMVMESHSTFMMDEDGFYIDIAPGVVTMMYHLTVESDNLFHCL